jgi:hypothetical protein
MKLILLAICFSFYCLTGISQERSDSLKLQELKISRTYSPQETANNKITVDNKSFKFIPSTKLNTETFETQEFNWLDPVFKSKKVFFIGETHYATSIANIKSKIFFRANQVDYVPLMIIEQPYSVGAYINHFIHLKNDIEAKKYFLNELTNFVYTEEDSAFYSQLRLWNNKNPKKQVSIGSHDLEYGYVNLCELILKPYFSRIKGVDEIELANLIELGKKQENEFFEKVEGFLERAQQQNLIGKYPFITPQYIKNVVTNFSSTNNAFRYSFDFYRAKALIRNLTDKEFHGTYFENGKVMIYGGGSHATNRFSYPEGGNFLSEGTYFENEFPLTKGKTYSIMLECLSYSLGNMSNRPLDKCIKQGSEYTNLLKRMQRGFEMGALDPSKPYFVYQKGNEVVKKVFDLSFNNKNQSVFLAKKNWLDFIFLYLTLDKDTNTYVLQTLEKVNRYDEYIVVPSSSVAVARRK